MPELISRMAPAMRALIELRQSLGYKDKNLICYLADFDRYVAGTEYDRPFLTRQAVEEWASAGRSKQSQTRSKRLQSLRTLGRFLAQDFPETYIPQPSWSFRQRSGFRPHIFTSEEIRVLLAEAARLPPADSLRPRTFVTIISLLYCAGMRVSEALALRLGDLDLREGVLIVRESKFHKSRALPLHESSVEALRLYLWARKRHGVGQDVEAALFVNEWQRPYAYPRFIATFLEIARRVGLRGPPGTKGPRIHDLRHTFAVHCLLRWYRDGGNVQARLPLLATYLGHVNITSTQVYLDITAELLDQAARRFLPPKGMKPCHAGALS